MAIAKITFPKGIITAEYENETYFVTEPLPEQITSDLSKVVIALDTQDEEGGQEYIELTDQRLLTFTLGVKIPSTGEPGFAFRFDDAVHYPQVNVTIDGASVSGILNGTTYILDEEVGTGVYDEVSVTTDGQMEKRTNVEVSKVDNFDGYAYAIIDIPADVLKEQKLLSNLEYLAMMTDVDLEV